MSHNCTYRHNNDHDHNSRQQRSGVIQLGERKHLSQRLSICGVRNPRVAPYSSKGARVDFIRDMFILNEIGVQVKYIF
jgi:hypothetical protein